MLCLRTPDRQSDSICPPNFQSLRKHTQRGLLPTLKTPRQGSPPARVETLLRLDAERARARPPPAVTPDASALPLPTFPIPTPGSPNRPSARSSPHPIRDLLAHLFDDPAHGRAREILVAG